MQDLTVSGRIARTNDVQAMQRNVGCVSTKMPVRSDDRRCIGLKGVPEHLLPRADSCLLRLRLRLIEHILGHMNKFPKYQTTYFSTGTYLTL